MLREVLEGAQISAEQLNVESFHGLIEVVQNADDLHAAEVRVAVRKSGKHSRLLIAHNGERVQLHHVIAMTLAFVSTKRDDPRAKGRFGIGLKTLGRLGESLTVHCAPYDFTIEGNQVRAAQAERSISGFYDPASTETLLDLRLREGFDGDEFQGWFASLGSESMVFLDTVRSLRLVALGGGRALVHHRLSETAGEVITLPGLSEPCRRTTLRAPRSNRTWQRYEIDRKMPPRLQRRYKAREETTPIAVAVPAQDDPGQIYAGLPLGASTRLPISLNAQFDIDVARRGIQHEELNAWFFARLAELIASVALQRLASDPAEAWRAIPLKSEQAFPADVWLADRIGELVETVQARVRRGCRIDVAGDDLRLTKFAYEAEPLDGLLSQAEIGGLRPGLTLLPRSARDRDGRWREVLAELGSATLVDVRESLRLLDWSDDDLGPRDVRWFIKLGRAAIESDLGTTLWSLRAVVAADGTRIVPPMADVEGELLLRSAQNDSLAFQLGLAHVIDPVYLSRWTDAVVVREWLEEHGMLRDAADPESTLRALASRDEDDEPLVIGDDVLRLMRDAFAGLDQRVQQELGTDVGRAIRIDVQRWEGSKRASGKGRPADAYLPASIEDRRDGWSKAAGRTPGISWIHPRYKDVLRRPGRRRAGSGQRRPLAARAFFGLLGAEVAPRLVAPARVETRYGDPASPIGWNQLAPPQVEALRALKRHATHLKGDRLSPDLLAVVQDLQREKGLRARRERARALLSALEGEWTRLYAPHLAATAVWSYGNWHSAGAIPTTWLANAMDEPWLTSEDGTKKAPRELAVHTPATEAIFGDDRGSFAYELDETDALSPTVRALGVQTDPQVSEMVEQLASLRDQGGAVDERTLALRYAAIGAACKKRDPSPDDLVGDLSMRKLRTRFGVQSNKTGLIYAGGRWLPPARVFLGAPIFGPRRAFVSERSAAERLWRALRIGPPSVGDCLDVLTEIAREAPNEQDEQILVNTYLYLDGQLESASSRELARLQNLPVWNGTAWQIARPIYVVADDDVAQALSSRIAVWKLPIAPTAAPGLISAAGSTVLTDGEFDPVVHQEAFVAGATVERQFAAAVELLRDWLTRHDPRLFEARSTSWEELARARIAVDPRLEIQLRLDRRAPVSVPARAHLTRDPLTFYFADTDAPGEDDAGGRVVASLFTGGDRDKLALAWSSAWVKAGKGARGAVTLVEDSSDGEALASLFDQAKGTTKVPRRPKTKAPLTKTKSDGEQGLPVRRLKQVEAFAEKVVDVISEDGGKAKTRTRRRGLRDDLPEGKQIGSPRPVSPSAPLAYSDEEKEELALLVLQIAINGDSAELRDYRHLRGVGADAFDKLRRYFELKATYGPLPDDITLTANEAERAFREGDKFFLAVVAGLEEGYETVVKIFPNPLRTLEFKPSTSVTLAGITGRRSALEVRFPPRGDGASAIEVVE